MRDLWPYHWVPMVFPMTCPPEGPKTTYLEDGMQIEVSSETLHHSHSILITTAPTYTQLVKHLQNHGFHWRQYSDWLCQDIEAIEAYWAMVRLKRILPPGKFETTVKSIKMHLVTLEEFDATPDIQLGGLYSPELEGPTPAGLVPPTIPAVVPPPGGRLPKHTLDSEEARDHNNWKISQVP